MQSFCAAPFSTIIISPDGNVFFCCKNQTSIGNIRHQSLEDIWKSSVVKYIRKDFRQSIRTQSCRHCWQIEDAGSSRSWRHTINERACKHLEQIKRGAMDESDEDCRPRYFELALSNLCNFRCRMCSPALSSALAATWLKMGMRGEEGATRDGLLDPFPNFEKFIAEFESYLPLMDQVYIFGGEPLLERRLPLLLRSMSPFRTHVRLAMTSNLSKINNNGIETLSLMNGFTTCYLGVSIDGDRQLNEYIRNGTDTATLEGNIRDIKGKFHNISVSATIAVQALNILRWPETVRYILEMMDPAHFETSLVTDTHLSVAVLPPTLRDQACATIRGFNQHELPWLRMKSTVDKDQIRRLGDEAIALMCNEPHAIETWMEFCHFVDRLDQHHGTRVFDLIPEFEEHWLAAQ